MNAGKKKPSLLVVGNGAIAVDDRGNKFIHDQTGYFLLELASVVVPVYVCPAASHRDNPLSSNLSLDQHGLASLVLSWATPGAFLKSIAGLFREILRSQQVYIFFPGTLGNIVALLCWIGVKRYGLYIRGGEYCRTYLQRMAIAGADYIFSVSPSITASLRKICRDVETIRPMVTLEANEAFPRPRPKAPPKKWKLLYVGNLLVDKGLRELLSAASTLRSKGFSFHLSIVGDGSLREELSETIVAQGLENWVELLGLVNDRKVLMREYEAADLFVFPSYHEGFPRVLYEAMIKALPIVTTMVGGIPGRMKDRSNCLAIQAKDAYAIVDAVLMLAGDLDLLYSIGQRGQQEVLNVLEHSETHSALLLKRVDGLVQ